MSSTPRQPDQTPSRQSRPPRTVAAELALVDGVLQPAVVTLDRGRIVAVAARPLSAADRRDADLLVAAPRVLLPALVDTHVHVNEPGRTEWEGFDTATAAAAAGGVGTILDMPLNSIPVTTTVRALQVKRAVAVSQTHVNVGFWGGAVPDNLGAGQLARLWEAGVYGFKCFTSPSGVDEFPALDDDQLLRAAAETAELDAPLIVHAEDPDLLAPQRDESTVYADFLASRPDAAETSAVTRVIDAARRTGARVHILHVSSARLLPLIAQARGEGVRITAETCPHYLTLAAEEIPDGATQYKCCPPIRDERNREALWQGLLDGTIDCVVSDHSPATARLKLGADGDWARAWGGIASLQTGLAAMWTSARGMGIPLERVAAWMGEAPARLFGLAGRGVIAVGAAADLAVFDPEAELPVDAAEMQYRNPVTAWDGRTLTGQVDATIVGGRLVWTAEGGVDRGVIRPLLRRGAGVHTVESCA